MNTEKANEIKNFLIRSIKEQLMIALSEKEFITAEKDLYNLVGSMLSCQFYINEDYKKVYLYYDFDQEIMFIKNLSNIRKMINGRLYSNFYRVINYKLEILGSEAEKSKSIYKGFATHTLDCIKKDTVSYWKCFDGLYRFIEDNQMVLNDHNIYYDYLITDSAIETEKSFISSLATINNSYDFTDNSNIPDAFDEYAELYEELYNRELTAIPDDEIITFYIESKELGD